MAVCMAVFIMLKIKLIQSNKAMASTIPIQFAEPAARQVFGIRNTRNKLIFDFFTQRKKIMVMETELKAMEMKVEDIKITMAREILILEEKYQTGYNLAIESKVTQLIRTLSDYIADKHTTDQKNMEQFNTRLNTERSIANDMAQEIDRLDALLPKTDKEYEALRIKLTSRATVQEIDDDNELV